VNAEENKNDTEAEKEANKMLIEWTASEDKLIREGNQSDPSYISLIFRKGMGLLDYRKQILKSVSEQSDILMN